MRQGSLWMRLFPALWVRWVISFGVAAVLLAALIVFVEHNNNNSEAKGSARAIERENAEAEIVIGADQAPHTFKLASGEPVRAGFVGAVHGYMARQIKRGSIGGPLQQVRCSTTGSRGGRVAYRCVAKAGDVNYPFVGIHRRGSHHVTYCKRDLPPLPSENIPVSPRCRL